MKRKSSFFFSHRLLFLQNSEENYGYERMKSETISWVKKSLLSLKSKILILDPISLFKKFPSKTKEKTLTHDLYPKKPVAKKKAVFLWKEQKITHYKFPEAKTNDLVKIPKTNIQINANALPFLQKMFQAAKKDGISIFPISGFRSIDRQKEIFYNGAKKRNISLEERAQISAPPRYSEHHTGYAIDFGNNKTKDFITKESNEFQWLRKNAYKYGFELSFSENNTQNVAYEPWHWRWIGDQKSKKIFEV